MKHIRTFEGYRIKKNRMEIIKEAVLQVNDIYKVKTMIDIPQSLINSYVKKVKETTGKNLRQFFGDVDIAEEIVKYINMNNLDVDKIPGGAIMGGQTQAQPQTTQPQAQMQVQPDQTQMQDQGQVQDGQAQVQDGQGQVQDGQTQVQNGQGQVQDGQAQVQNGQGQVQDGQAQVQVQTGDEFEEPQQQGQAQGQFIDEDEEDDDEDEDLPI